MSKNTGRLPRALNDTALLAAAFFVMGSLWLLVGTVYGMFTATHLVSPELFGSQPGLIFGRTRPIHVNTMIFGFNANLLWGVILFMVPQLLKTRLWSVPLGWVGFVLWNTTVMSGEIGFSLGYTQGREYAEYTWPFDVCMMAALLIYSVNLAMTILRRREPTLYVSVWYSVGTAIWFGGIYPIGNVMWHPGSGAMPGLLDSVFLWTYAHDLVGLLLTPAATGIAFYVLPRVARRPIFSHTLSLLGFWMLVTLYTHIGGHHILQTPIPNWLKVMSVVDSMMMMLTVFIVISNLLLSIRGSLGVIWRDAPARFVLLGLFWYLITCIQGPFQSLPSVQTVTHLNNWTIGHSHIAVLGFSGFIALGGMWHVLPLATGKNLWSTRLVQVQIGLILFGLLGFFVVLTIAGLIQGESWWHGDTVYRVLPRIVPYYALRAGFGISIFTGALLGVVNLVMTVWKGERRHPEEQHDTAQAQGVEV